MSFDRFSVQTVSPMTLDTWVALVPPRDPGAVDRLLTELRNRPERTRVVLSDERGPVAGCVVERNAPGATTWTPRMRAGLNDARRQAGLVRLATYIAEMCVQDGLRYLECTLKSDGESERAWRSAMLSTGFVSVAKKCRYERTLSTAPTLDVFDLDPWVVVADAEDPGVKRLYDATLEDSRDRSTHFEARHGAGLGDADLVLVVALHGHLAGLCALEHEAGAERGWIKYVGTAPFARRRGIAAALIPTALARLASAGAKWADCLIDDENCASIALHKRFGFRTSRECGYLYCASLPLVI